jgi:hypothetical protein
LTPSRLKASPHQLRAGEVAEPGKEVGYKWRVSHLSWAHIPHVASGGRGGLH